MKKKNVRKEAVRKARGPRPHQFPVYLSSSAEEWRAKKRQEWKELCFALGRYEYGCAKTTGRVGAPAVSASDE